MHECHRTFDRDGHFENLIIYDAPDATKQWRYGPFLTTRLSPTTPDGFLELPSEAEIKNTGPSNIEGACCFMILSIYKSADCVPDFSFDWSIRYSAMSPAKLSLAQSTIRSTGIWGKMMDDSYSAKALDKEDFNSE